MTRRKIVLYNPKAEFYTMPLALTALASCVDRSRFDVVIVDGRLEQDAMSRVLQESEDALCLGLTVLTGAPLRDALDVTQAVRRASPTCPVIWGGWHPSLFPLETLEQAGVDAVVQGQGEHTFVEIVERLSGGASLEGVPGAASHGTPNALRPIVDVNTLPAHDYEHLDVEAYFRRKGQRQLDYVTSQGCRFRCTFCADPTVYRRSWSGLAPERVGHELAHWVRKFGVRDVGFQDETFFTQSTRVAGIAEELLRRSLNITWMATMRADQGSRLDDGVWSLCRDAGLRRVMVGLESGSREMLDWMKKDVTIEETLETAERCRTFGVEALFNLIVGFPGEPPESVEETLAIAKRLRSMGPEFQVAIFYYKPYPGTEITETLARDGYPLPHDIEAWAEIGAAGTSPWISPESRERIERFKFYQQIGWARTTPFRAPVQALARWRCRNDFYRYPFEKTVLDRVRPLSPVG